MNKNKNHILQELILAVEQHYGFAAGGDKGRAVLAEKLQKTLESEQIELIEAESKNVTILLSDIRGFTAITESYAAKVVMDMLNRYFELMTKIVIKYNGTIDKFMGDSIMVLFGAPSSCTDDVERAIACAVDMQKAMSDFNEQNMMMGLPEIFIGIGINSGEVMAGDLGSRLHSEYTVIGDEVNLVSRIEAQSLRGQILLSENTYRLGMHYIETGKPNSVYVKGKREPVNLYELHMTERPTVMQVPRREVRRSPRVEVSIPIFYQCVGEGKQILPHIHRGDVMDLSYHGMRVVIQEPLVRGAEIKMSLSLHLMGDETTDVYAKVIEIAEFQGTYAASMEFTFLDTMGESAIKQYVDSMLFHA